MAGPFREGQKLKLICRAPGGKPPPDIAWYHGDERLSIARDSSVCQLSIAALSREMSGAKLRCRVSPPLLQMQARDVILKISLIRVENNIKSNPLEFWKHIARLRSKGGFEPTVKFQGDSLTGAAAADAFARFFASVYSTDIPQLNTAQANNNDIHSHNSNYMEVEGELTRSILTWKVRREDSGRELVCRVSNPWFPAYTLEDSIMLEVLSRPECSAGSVVQQLAGAPGGEVRARCSVSAPSTRDAGPLRFYWTYNGTKDVLPIPASNVTVMGSTSSVIHGLPQVDSDQDLGWLACWASNDVGNQREPCLFRIMPAAYPEPPSNCEVEDGFIRCEPGHDGGLPQRFILEALEVRQHEPVRNQLDATMNDQGISGRGLTEAVYRASNEVTPQFPLDALSPGRYTFLIYSETPRGRSLRPAALHSIPIRNFEAEVDKPDSLQTMTPPPPQAVSPDNSVALLVGASLALVLLTILTTLCVSIVVIGTSRRNVGVSMYGTSLSQSIVPTVVVRGHRGSRVLAARWSGVLEDTPLAVLALDARQNADTDSGHSDGDINETELITHENMETQTEP
ncbi:unnamed protein product [Leptidea sinapis]|uniref:Ig-like domain-containing protein n=1 Tax=Leptidea sinapis TaxID=189913 RepID=A0A5E4PN51_9NEOP|nr:unnamed protein product [Leptidea sinapis]